MVEFLQKSERHGDKIARVNSMPINKYINLLSFYTVLGVYCDRGRFSVHSPFIERSMTTDNHMHKINKSLINN